MKGFIEVDCFEICSKREAKAVGRDDYLRPYKLILPVKEIKGICSDDGKWSLDIKSIIEIDSFTCHLCKQTTTEVSALIEAASIFSK